MTSTAVVLGVGTPEAAPDCVCCDMMKFSFFRIRASEMGRLLLSADRGWDRLQSRIRNGTHRRSSSKGSLRAAALMRKESLQRCWVQCPQRHQWPDRNVFVIHQLFLRERQCFHKASCLVLCLRVNQKDDALAIAARIPLADLPVEVELHCCLNLFWYDGHDLLRGYALPGSLNDQHCGGFGHRYAGHARGAPGL